MIIRKKIDIWEVLIWLGGILIITWALLKAFGIINTPVWIEMIPYIGGGLSILGGGYKLIRIAHKIDSTDRKMNSVLKMRDDFITVKK